MMARERFAGVVFDAQTKRFMIETVTDRENCKCIFCSADDE